LPPTIQEAAENGKHLIEQRATRWKRRDETTMRKIDETQKKK
jgi:hypothetical protein